MVFDIDYYIHNFGQIEKKNLILLSKFQLGICYCFSLI